MTNTIADMKWSVFVLVHVLIFDDDNQRQHTTSSEIEAGKNNISL